VKRWNEAWLRRARDERIELPSSRFFRRQGIYASAHFTPTGELISADEFGARAHEWLPSDADRAYVSSLMQPVIEPGKMANWVAAPRRGIDGKPVEFEYVRLTRRASRAS
jgi:benzoyl-CoA 2,3-dioxygenase component B